MDVRHHFEGKKITIMGLGLLGRGVGDARFLAKQGAELIITDLKSEEELAPSLAELSEFSNIQYVLGEHRLEDFRDRDFILKAAGVPLDSMYIEEARANGIPIKMSASWFAEVSQLPVIGVTGTRGKSTTTHMIHSILEAGGKPVLLGGNVRGVSTLSLLEDATEDHVALLELDSWQCQGFGEEKMSPHIAVFTTFFPDHLNYYHGDLDAYLADKAFIFLHQTENDTFVLGSQAESLVMNAYREQIKGKLVVVRPEDTLSGTLSIPGEHNRYNALLAAQAARAYGVSEKAITEGLESFQSVPGRLELLGTVSGKAVYNDNNATTPDATIAAIEAFEGKGELTLIMGGADKDLSMDELLRTVHAKVKQVILLPGSGTDRIKHELPDALYAETLSEAVEAALRLTPETGTILFSPAFASFGLFTNEYDRNDQFVELIRPHLS